MPELDDSRKQVEWDRLCADSPQCKVCGSPVIRYGDTYHEYGDTIICENCHPGFSDALEDAVVEIMALVKSKAMRRILEA